MIKIPDELINALEKKDCIIFIGSGLSVPLGFPSWFELIDKMAKILKDSPLLEENDKSKINELLLSDKAEDFLEIASMFKNNKIIVEERYSHLLMDSFSYSTDELNEKLKESKNHYYLKNIKPRAIITTNYDTLLESTFGEWDNVIDFKSPRFNFISQKPFYILKAHGCLRLAYDFRNDIILSKEDYVKLYEGENIESMKFRENFRGLIKNHYTLFIGYGLRDPGFNRFMIELHKIHKGDIKPSYAVVEELGQDSGNFVKNYSTILLKYKKNNHIEVTEFLKDLENRVVKKYSSNLSSFEEDKIYSNIRDARNCIDLKQTGYILNETLLDILRNLNEDILNIKMYCYYSSVKTEMLYINKNPDQRNIIWEEIINKLKNVLKTISSVTLLFELSSKMVDYLEDGFSKKSNNKMRENVTYIIRLLEKYFGQERQDNNIKALLLSKKSALLRISALNKIGIRTSVDQKYKLYDAERCIDRAFKLSELNGEIALQKGLSIVDILKYNSDISKYISDLRRAEDLFWLSAKTNNKIHAFLTLSRFYRHSNRPLASCFVFKEYLKCENSDRRAFRNAYIYGESLIQCYYLKIPYDFLKEQYQVAKELLKKSIEAGYSNARNIMALAFLEAISGNQEKGDKLIKNIFPNLTPDVSWDSVLSFIKDKQDTIEANLIDMGIVAGLDVHEIWNRIGTYVSDFMSNKELAKNFYLQSIKMHNDNNIAYVNLARLYLLEGKKDESKEILKKVSRKDFKRYWFRILWSFVNIDDNGQYIFKNDKESSSLYHSGKIVVNLLDIEYMCKYKLINEKFTNNGINPNKINARQLIDVFNELIQIPNFIQLISEDKGLSYAQQTLADKNTIIQNKRKISEIFNLSIVKTNKIFYEEILTDYLNIKKITNNMQYLDLMSNIFKKLWSTSFSNTNKYLRIQADFRKKYFDSSDCAFFEKESYLYEIHYFDSKVNSCEIEKFYNRVKNSVSKWCLYISLSGFENSAKEQAVQYIGTKNIILMDQNELIISIEHFIPIDMLLIRKQIDLYVNKNPYYKCDKMNFLYND